MEKFLHGLEPLHLLSWSAVFEIWAGNEEGNPAWQKVAADRGFRDWRDWRGSYVRPLRLSERTWKLYRVTDPMATVPTFRGGPFRAWIEQIYGDASPTPTFAEIAGRLNDIKNEGVLSLLASFPEETTTTGILTTRGIITLEGMHRHSAIAAAAALGRRIETDLTIALGSELEGDAELFASVIGGHRKGQEPIRRD